MLTKEKIKELLVEQKKLFLDTKDSYERDILIEIREAIFKTQEVLIITGVRRCGKSYLLRLIWKMIKEQKKITDQQVLYINFEDERLVELKYTELDLILESYSEIFSPEKQTITYLFFDEIQHVKNWERFINRLRESKKYKIFITGSNASLLSKEIATHLTGRGISFNLYPLSFHEYVGAKSECFSKQDIYDLKKRIGIKKLLNEYLQIGGFPEVVSTGYKPLLQEYFRDIIYRDIMARYKIKYEASLREIVTFLLSNIGCAASLERVARMTKIKNLNTVKNYLFYLANSYLFNFIPMYSYSIKQQIYNPDKAYIVDLGLYNELSFQFSLNKGNILENFVFNEMRWKYKQIFYGLDKLCGEVDFIVSVKNKVEQLIQVCFGCNDEKTKEREVQPLLAAMNKYDLTLGLVITDDYESEEKYGKQKIYFIPAWKYFI